VLDHVSQADHVLTINSQRERESLWHSTEVGSSNQKPEIEDPSVYPAGPSSIKALYFQYVNWTNWLLSLCRFGTLVVGALSGPYDSLPSSNFDTRRRQRNVSSSSGLNEVSTAALLIYLFIYLFILTYIYILIIIYLLKASHFLSRALRVPPLGRRRASAHWASISAALKPGSCAALPNVKP
jgi:hypothetical protein